MRVVLTNQKGGNILNELKRWREITAYPCSQLFRGYNFKWRGIQQLLRLHFIIIILFQAGRIGYK